MLPILHLWREISSHPSGFWGADDSVRKYLYPGSRKRPVIAGKITSTFSGAPVGPARSTRIPVAGRAPRDVLWQSPKEEVLCPALMDSNHNFILSREESGIQRQCSGDQTFKHREYRHQAPDCRILTSSLGTCLPFSSSFPFSDRHRRQNIRRLCLAKSWLLIYP